MHPFGICAARLVATLAVVLLGAACANGDDGADTTSVATTADAELTTLELQRRAQKSLVSSFSGSDIHCAEPPSTDPGTSFGCTLETDGRTLTFTATVAHDGSVSIAID